VPTSDLKKCLAAEFVGSRHSPCWNCTTSYKFSVSVKKMGEGRTGGTSDIVKVRSSGEDPRATGGLVSNLAHPRVNRTKPHCAAAFSLQVLKSCTGLDLSFLYISILRTHTKFVRKNKMLALGVCFPQHCLRAGRRFAASRSRLNCYRTTKSIHQYWYILILCTQTQFLSGIRFAQHFIEFIILKSYNAFRRTCTI